MFHPVPVRVQAQAHDAQHEDLPEIHAGAPRGFFAGEDFGCAQGEDPGLERGVRPDPLQAGEDRRQLGAALERQTHLFDGRELESGLGLEVVAHGGECCRFRPWNPRKVQAQRRHSHTSITTKPNVDRLIHVECRALNMLEFTTVRFVFG